MKRVTGIILFLFSISISGQAWAKQVLSTKLAGSENGIVLWEQNHVAYADNGVEVRAKAENKNAPLYLSLDVKDAAFIDGAAPIVEFSFEYFDVGHEELTFDIDSNDPLHGPLVAPGQWRGAGGVQFMDTGTWQRKSIVFTDAEFSNRLNGADIRFRVVKHPELRLRNISLTKLEDAPAVETKLKQGKTPNVLMVVFDDLNDYVGAFGDPNAITPGWWLYTVIGRTEKEARAMLDMRAIKFAGPLVPSYMWKGFGAEHPLGDDFGGLVDFVPTKYEKAEILDAIDKVPVDVIAEKAMWGTPDMIEQRLRLFIEAGLRHVVMQPASALVSKRDALYSLRQVVSIQRSLKRWARTAI